MLAEALRTLYGYNGWATERLLDTVARLTPGQFLAPGGAGHGSVRDTLVHLIGTQRGWLSWWDGSLPVNEAYRLKLDPAGVPDLAAVLDYVRTLPNGAEWRMPLWRMMFHVANHGTQHRSEVAAMLTGFGHSPGDLDLLFYP